MVCGESQEEESKKKLEGQSWNPKVLIQMMRKLLGDTFHKYLPSKVLLSCIPLGSMYNFLNAFEITLD